LDYSLLEGSHVRLHRLWTYIRFHDNLTSAERAHVVSCKECRISFGACLQAESFGSVLREFPRNEEGRYE
jgi:hypothetical protein